MKNKILLLLFILLQFKNVLSNELETLLFNLSDVSFTKIETVEGFNATYQLKIKQPLDHRDLSKGHFYQQVILYHQGFDQPTTLITEGL
jgi:hypothetical protein